MSKLIRSAEVIDFAGMATVCISLFLLLFHLWNGSPLIDPSVWDAFELLAAGLVLVTASATARRWHTLRADEAGGD